MCESDSEDERIARVEATKAAFTKERIRLKAIDINKKVVAGRGSPVSSLSRKVSRTPRMRAASTDSLEPFSKRSKPASGIARIVDLDQEDVVGTETELDTSALSKKKAMGKDKDTKTSGGSRDAGKSSKKDAAVDKAGGSNNNKVSKDDRTSQVLPQRFWPSDISADQVDKLSVDQCHRLKKLELEERSQRGGENDLPGVVIAPMELFLPEITLMGGEHDFVKKIVPAFPDWPTG